MLPQTIQSRSSIPALLDQLGLTGWGVEIGVDWGRYSAEILAGSKLQRLFSIDPWAREERGGPDDYPYVLMLQALAVLRPFGLRSVVMRMDSLAAAEVFSDASLDFVYIDGSHLYESVKADFGAWYPKVAQGGIIAGHDWEPWNPGPHVREAVMGFATALDLAVVVTESDGFESGQVRHSWVIQKPMTNPAGY